MEFLNQQMDPAEVLAVEIKQYVGGDLKTLVPRVVGQTVEAQQNPSASERRETAPIRDAEAETVVPSTSFATGRFRGGGL